MSLPVASAASVNVKGGMALGDVAALKAQGVQPDLGVFWVGPWTKSNWGAVDNQLRYAKSQGVTPVIQWYYWGDDISPTCVEKGCWSSLHNAWKSKSEWNGMASTLAKKIGAIMGSSPAYVVMETEFNKQGMATYEPFDGYMASQAGIFRAHAPSAELIIGFGSWSREHYKVYDRTIAATDLLGFQDLAGSTRDSDAKYLASVTTLVSTSKYLRDTFKKPTFLTHWGASSYPEPKYADYQERLTKEFFNRMDELAGAGMIGFIYRDLHDNPKFNTANYYGIAERYWGFIRADGSWKPAANDWFAGMKGLRSGDAPSPAPSPSPSPTTGAHAIPATLEGEAFPTHTTGANAYDGAASNDRAWLLWSNGYIEQKVRPSASGTFEFEIKAAGRVAANDWPLMIAEVDGKEIGRWKVVSTSYWSYRGDAWLSGNADHTLRISFVNDYRGNGQDRNLYVDLVRVSGDSAPATAPAGPITIEAESMATHAVGGRLGDGRASGGAAWNVWSDGAIKDTLHASEAARYEIVIKAKGTSAAGVSPRMVLRIDGQWAGEWAVNARDAYWDYRATRWLTAGEHDVAIEFVNDHRTRTEDRNLHVDVVKVEKSG